ncbi:acyl-CoA dehydrogenase family protein [Candidatus Methylospira mobilis]|uniref:Acyl-CoA dehydrogenase family protein n=1 Tax=Candidatus Methylospira mobilis TaxID=1808979 RepID=A0A5Q0BF06_9GAMM|nr:acyl-CoA dehydrogenase family protein [Candidatus Methylospira mobilis]QFY42455.1 acyl-CoA dehydrogenase family protein [Candidatus Methylospira mobilis]WNV04439.1 acyl-CoA dehydrogenase family protein [Candidatus Methylospira mobilis]
MSAENPAKPDLPAAPFSGSYREADLLSRFHAAASSGILRHALPEAYGGYGDGFGKLCEIHRQLGTASRDTGLVLAINAHLWGAVFPILHHGNTAQRERLLPQLIHGELLAGHAITEPDCGSDVQAMTCRADPVADGFLLSGSKSYITNIPMADWLVVYAKLNGQITAFLVSSNDPGCRSSGVGALQTCRGSSTGNLTLDACPIGKDRLLGKPGSGAMIMQRALELERAFVFAGISGIMDWQLQQTVAYSRTRRSGDVHLGKHQAIAHRLAEMKLRLDTVDLWLRECARLCDAGQRLTLAAAQTKLYAAEAFLQSSLDAVQIMGASGLIAENGLAGLVQDALGGRLFSGSSEIQKNIIAALLGSGDGYRRKM